MKSALLTAALFVTSSAFACPMLQGNWTCKESDGSTKSISVTQEDIPNGVMYHVKDTVSGKSEDIAADGAAHSFTKPEYTGTMKTTCVSTTQLKSYTEFSNANIDLKGTADMTVDLKDPNTLVTTSVAKYTIGGGAEQTHNSVDTCTK